MKLNAMSAAAVHMKRRSSNPRARKKRMESSFAEAHDVAMRNPFGVQDVMAADDREVEEFAAQAPRKPVPDDPNAAGWSGEGWSSRWNGGAAGPEWKQGRAQIVRRGE